MTEENLMEISGNYTQVPNVVWDAIPFLEKSQWIVFMAFIRKTYGYQKESDYISHSQLIEMTGMSKNSVKAAVNQLIELNMVRRVANSTSRKSSYYVVPRDQRQWNIWPQIQPTSRAQRVSQLPPEGQSLTPRGSTIDPLEGQPLTPQKKTLKKISKETPNKPAVALQYWNKLNNTRLKMTAERKRKTEKFLSEYSLLTLCRMINEISIHSPWKNKYNITYTWLVRPTKYDDNAESLLNQRRKRIAGRERLTVIQGRSTVHEESVALAREFGII